MAWKKQGDAYFADTFDRDALMCSMDAAFPNCYDSVGISSVCGATSGSIGSIGEWTVAKGVNSHSEGDICYVNNVATMSEIDTVSDKLKDLQAQINALKKNLEKPKVTDGLRSALKTLQYKREVE